MSHDPAELPRRVLIVEDETHQRNMLERAIGALAFEVTATASAEDALRAIESAPPMIAVLDLNLPGMSGLELAAALHERLPTTQMIILTGYGDLPAAQEAIRLDVVDFLSKPCPLGELETALHRAEQKALAAQSASPPEPSARKIDDVERSLIEAALERHDGNRTRAAEELGISVRTLYYRLSRYQVERRRH